MGTEAKQKKKSKKGKGPAVEMNMDVQLPELAVIPSYEHEEVENVADPPEALPITEELPVVEPLPIEGEVAVNDKKSRKSKSKKEKKSKKSDEKPISGNLQADLSVPAEFPQLNDGETELQVGLPSDVAPEEPQVEADGEISSKRGGSKRKKVKEMKGAAARASRGISGLFSKKGDHETGESGAETEVVEKEPPKAEKKRSRSRSKSKERQVDLPPAPQPEAEPVLAQEVPYGAPEGEYSSTFPARPENGHQVNGVENGNGVPEPPVLKRKKKSKRFKNNEQQRTSHVFKDADLVRCSVRLLDDDLKEFVVHRKGLGRELFEAVCDYLNVAERDYFGLRFLHETGVYFWLDVEKDIRKQMEEAHLKYSWEYDFCVKFYPPEPSLLQEELTRYLLCLQVRRDLISPHGELRNCSFVTQALLGSYVAQSELGDYEPDVESSLHSMRFSARQDPRAAEYQVNPEENRQIVSELLERITELYRTHAGMRPDEADYRFLENAKRLELYGIEFVEATDAGGMPIRVGVYYNGVVVYQGRVRINRFAWPKVLKLSYHGTAFKLRVRPEMHLESRANVPVQETVVFHLQDPRVAKRLWKAGVEQHTFYRKKGDEMRKKASPVSRIGTLVTTIGSSRFHYSGRTLYQYRTGPARQDPPPAVYRTLQKGQARSMPALERERANGLSLAGPTANFSTRDVRDPPAPREPEPATLPRVVKRRVPSPPAREVNPVGYQQPQASFSPTPVRPPPPTRYPNEFETDVDTPIDLSHNVPATYYMPPDALHDDHVNATDVYLQPNSMPLQQPSQEMVTLYDDTNEYGPPQLPPKASKPPPVPPKANASLDLGPVHVSAYT